VLKSHQVGSTSTNDTNDFTNMHGDQSSELAFMNSGKHAIDASQILRSNTQRYTSDHGFDSSRRSSIQNAKRTSSMYTTARNSFQPITTTNNKSAYSNDDTNKLTIKNDDKTVKPSDVVKTKSFIPGKELLEQSKNNYNSSSNSNQQTSNKVTNSNQEQQATQKSPHHLNPSFDKSRLKRIDFLKSLSQEREKF